MGERAQDGTTVSLGTSRTSSTVVGVTPHRVRRSADLVGKCTNSVCRFNKISHEKVDTQSKLAAKRRLG